VSNEGRSATLNSSITLIVISYRFNYTLPTFNGHFAGAATAASRGSGSDTTSAVTAVRSKPSSNEADVVAFKMGISILGIMFSVPFLL
jgi:hypothetical protein